MTVDLGEPSRTARGPDGRVPDAGRSARSRSRSGTRTSASVLNYGGVSPVGFAEIRLRDDAPGARPVRVQRDREDAVGPARHGRRASSLDRPLVLLMNRERVIPVPPRSDPEQSLVRSFSLPTARGFGVAGEVAAVAVPARRRDRPAARVHGPGRRDVVRAPLGRAAGPRVRGARRGPDDRLGDAVLDGDRAVHRRARCPRRSRSTVWTSSWSRTGGTRCRPSSRSPTTRGSGARSTCRRCSDQAAAERGRGRAGDVPADHRLRVPGHRARGAARSRRREWYCECDLDDAGRRSPSSGCPACRRCGSRRRSPTSAAPTSMTVDGRPVPVRVVGTTADALALRAARRSCSCTGDGAPVADARCRARTSLRTQAGNRFGFDVDRLDVASQAGGDAWTTLRRRGRARRRAGRRPAVGARRSRCWTSGRDEDEGPDHRRRPSRSGWCSARAATRAGGRPSTARSSASRRWPTATATAGWCGRPPTGSVRGRASSGCRSGP